MNTRVSKAIKTDSGIVNNFFVKHNDRDHVGKKWFLYNILYFASFLDLFTQDIFIVFVGTFSSILKEGLSKRDHIDLHLHNIL